MAYHILNGDALAERFPTALEGVIIVVRECLVDGIVKGANTTELYEARARFLSSTYGGTVQEYYDRVVKEFDKLKQIPHDSEVYLWFEDDLFCQVNFWFISYLLSSCTKVERVMLVRPPKHTPYSFGGLTNVELIEALEHSIELHDISAIATLWTDFQRGDLEQLLETATELQSSYSFILPAVQAHIDRMPRDGHPGKPKQILLDIMAQQQTQEFKSVFQEFSKRAAIYGFGDLQVKRLFNELMRE